MRHLLILPALLALSACGDTPAELKAKAEKAFAEHDYRTAKLLTAQALDAEPGDRAMQLLRARSLIALGDGEGAGAVLGPLSAKSPEPEVIELAAEAALLRKAPDEALRTLGALSTVEAERLRGLAAIQQDNLASAQEHFARAVDMGGNARAFADLARIRLIGEDRTTAEKLAAKARALAPDGIDTLLLDGQLALRKGDLLGALGRYDRAARLYPTSLAALEGKAAVLGDLGRLDDMKKVVDGFAAIAPDDPTTTYLSARLAAARKDWSGARKIIEARKSALAVRDPLRLIYGETLLRLGQVNQAASQLAPIVRDAPNNRPAALLLAEAQIAANRPGDAVSTLRPLVESPYARSEEIALMVRAAEASGDPALALYRKRLATPPARAIGSDLADGDRAMRAGNWAGAAEAYDRILSATNGRNILVLNNMAYAQLMLGNYDKANTFAQRALKLAPDNPSVLDTAGWAQFKSGGDVANAKRLLSLAAQKAPANATIRAHLEEVARASS